ncbi:unnamed protein product [Eruca vesicaria subsp. sativa]|uniref:Uncharacterized protein n=1 Tax=Eruca vesicaria subsp. sativa TaxID=29727 RepID=A0ABC8K4U4_ERUVS|nr:unnamed protein product [Eruca vesicaria subsp. sativa]
MVTTFKPPLQGIVVTNDGNMLFCSTIELSRTQDEEVGDGTTSLVKCYYMLPKHSLKRVTIICRAYNKALEDAIAVLDKIAMSIHVNDRATVLGLVKSCIGTKFTSQFGHLSYCWIIDLSQYFGIHKKLKLGLRSLQALTFGYSTPK